MRNHRQTFVHKAKNKDMSRWTSGNDMAGTGWSFLVESFSVFPDSKVSKSPINVSWPPTWKGLGARDVSDVQGRYYFNCAWYAKLRSYPPQITEEANITKYKMAT